MAKKQKQELTQEEQAFMDRAAAQYLQIELEHSPPPVEFENVVTEAYEFAAQALKVRRKAMASL